MVTTQVYYSLTLIVWVNKLKPKIIIKILARITKSLSNYSTKSKCYDDSNKLVVAKMKDETTSVAVESEDVFDFGRW